jgi:hypothetical protein
VRPNSHRPGDGIAGNCPDALSVSHPLKGDHRYPTAYDAPSMAPAGLTGPLLASVIPGPERPRLAGPSETSGGSLFNAYLLAPRRPRFGAFIKSVTHLPGRPRLQVP